jgi:aspartate kinase
VLSSFRDDQDAGTLITKRERRMESLKLTGLACEGSHVQVIVRGLPVGMSATTNLLSRLADAGVSLDMVAHADTTGGHRQLNITVREDGLARALPICEEVARSHGANVTVQRGLTRVAIVGSGMQNTPGVYARAFRALEEAGVEAHAIGSSAITIIFLVESKDEDKAVRVLHEAFDFGSE